MIQWGAIGASLSSTSAGKAKANLGTAPSSKTSGPLNVVAPKKRKRCAPGCTRVLQKRLQGQTVEYSRLAGHAVHDLPRGGGGPVAPGPPQRGRQRAPVRLAAAQIFQPVLVDTDGGSAPRAFQPGVKLAQRKTGDEVLAAIEQRALAKRSGDRRRFAVEIIQRQAPDNRRARRAG